MNYYNCSNGEKVSQATIDKRRSETYQRMYADNCQPICIGCLINKAAGSGHIIPQAVAKSEGMTELCWTEDNICPFCHSCNSIAENISSETIKLLHCYDYILQITKKYLPSRYNKMIS